LNAQKLVVSHQWTQKFQAVLNMIY
jgi:hypothetical protein